jgi:hypothetical protein
MFPSENPEEIHIKYAIILLGKTTHLISESQLVSDVVKRSHSRLREEYAMKLVGEPLVPIIVGLSEASYILSVLVGENECVASNLAGKMKISA